MQLTLELAACEEGAVLPLLPRLGRPPCACHFREGGAYTEPLPIGCVLSASNARLRVCGHTCIPLAGVAHACWAPMLRAECDLAQSGHQSFSVTKDGYSLAWITLSDKGAKGEREDTSGPAIATRLGESLPIAYAQGYLLPDDAAQLRATLTTCALVHHYDIICTSGGTGLTSRDTTPEATARVLDTELPGFVIAMMTASLQKTPRAVLSRACAGILGTSLILNFPGSRKGAIENLEAVLPALEHTLAKLHNDPSDCGGQLCKPS